VRHRALCASVLALVGCTTFDHELIKPPECVTNAECTAKLSGDAIVPAVCVQEPAGHCVQLTSEDCTVVTGDYTDDHAVLIASLLQTTGIASATNLPRQQATIMAVEQINSITSGGILQSSAPGDARKLVMVSCDVAANLPRVATHLITELQVPAIVGPNLSQDTLDLTLGNDAIGLPSSARAGTALFTPAGVASAIATVPDNGLTYMMTPSDIQRTPLTKAQINALEIQLKTERAKSSIKLAIFYRSDALGTGTRDGLSTLMLNNASLSTAISLGQARQDSYDLLATDQHVLVAAYAAFLPDIVVVVGGAEAIKYFVQPLEVAWPAGMPRPYYVATDAAKVPDLLTAAATNNDLRLRFRGTGIASPPESLEVFSAFQLGYGQRWKDADGNPQPATTSGMGSAYDAVYTIALALVGKTDVHGPSLVTGLAGLANNPLPCTYDALGVLAPCFSVTDHARTLFTSMGALLEHEPVTEIGTLGRLEWDAQGAKASGLIEMWCINATGPKPVFSSSGLTYDIKTQTSAGTYVQCGP
jgi:hypothetical protein